MMEKKIHPERLQHQQKFLPHPYLNSTSMVVKRTLEQARKAKEKIDHVLSEQREMKIRSSSLPEKIREGSNTNRSFILAKKALMAVKKVEKRPVNQEVDEEAEDTSSSDTSSSEKERVLDKIPAVDVEDDDDEVEENYSEIAEESDLEEEVKHKQKEEDTVSEEEDCSEKSDKTNSVKESVMMITSSVSNLYTETKTISGKNKSSNKNQTSTIAPKLQEDIIYPIKKNNNILNSNIGKGIEDKELVVLRETKIRSSSDTNSSSLDKKLCSVNSDQGSSSCSSDTPVSNSSSNSNEKGNKIYEKKFKNINTDNEDEEDVNSDENEDDDDDDEIPGSTSNNNTNESNSDAFMTEQQQQAMFAAIDPESSMMMRNPWFANFYQGFQCRPNWDSSPYNPSCNRPAWDHSLYIEAKEKFQRHEAVKLNNNNMMDFSNFPNCFSGSGMMDGSAFFDMNRFQKTYYQFGQMFGNRNRYVQTSKRVFSKIKNGPQSKKITSPGGNETNGLKKNLPNINNNNMILNNNNNNNNISPNGGKDKTTNPVINLKVTNNNNNFNDNNNYSSQGKLLGAPSSTLSQRAGSTESKASSFSTKSSVLDTNNNNSNYRNQRSRSCPKSSKIFQNTINRRNEKLKNEPIKPQKLFPNPLPRVAHLTKASLRRTSEQSSNIQVIDERGRPRLKWNPSPFVSINKSSAWDENSSIKNDYYRLKYFGWM